MAVRKLKSLGEIFVDDGGKILIKTKSGNMFTIDDASDLTTIEAKDLLIGSVRKYDDDDDEDEDTRAYKPYAKIINKSKTGYNTSPAIHLATKQEQESKMGKY